MMSSDALYFLAGALLAGLIGTGVWALDGSPAGAGMDLNAAFNDVASKER